MSSSHVINYCNHDTNEQFERKVLVEVLENLRRFDLRTKELKPTMAKARKRIIFGGMETRKFMEIGKVKALIIAKNLTDEIILDDDFKFCMAQEGIPKLFCLTRKQLGNALVRSENGTARIGIVGILKLDGVFEVWNEIIAEWENLKNSWMKRVLLASDVNVDLNRSVWFSSYYGHYEVLTRLKDQNGDILRTHINRGNPDFMGKTPLIVSVERNHVDVVELLLEMGADQDIPDFSMNRPVHLIKSSNVAKLFDFSFFYKKNACGLTGIDLAILNENLDVLKVFFEMNPIENSELNIHNWLFLSTRNRNFKVINFLINHFKYSNDELFTKIFNHENGNTLLMESVQNGSYEIFKYLVSKISIIDYAHVNYENDTIWDISSKNKTIGILRYLDKRINTK